MVIPVVGLHLLNSDKPIKFIGTGEKMVEPLMFSILQGMAEDRILGMGDGEASRTCQEMNLDEEQARKIQKIAKK